MVLTSSVQGCEDEQSRTKENRERNKLSELCKKGEGAVADIHQQRVESSTARGIAARRTTSSSAWKKGQKQRKRRREGGQESRRWQERG